MRSPARRIVALLIAWRLPLLVLGLAAAAVAFLPAQTLQFDRSIENMFAQDDPLLRPYERLKRTFGGNEIVLAVYGDEELFHPDGRGIRRLAEVSRTLKAVPGVREVVSLDQPLGTLVADDHAPLARPVRELFQGYTHSADGRIASVVCMLEPESRAAVPRQEVIDRLRRVVESLPPPLSSGMITGEPVMMVDGFRYVEADGARLARASTLLLALAILLSFRSVRWVVVPIAVVQLARLLTQATLVWFGLELSLVSSMLTAVVTVVGIGAVVHVIVRFRDARQEGLAPRDALAQAGEQVAEPIFWALATTAAGFASLMVAGVGPVRDFGLMMSIGALMVIASVALLVPGLGLLGRWDADPKRAWGEGALDRQLLAIAGWIKRRPKTLGLATLVLAAGAIAGIGRLEVESDFTRNFRAQSPIVRAYAFVEKNLGGAGIWDVVLPAPEWLNWEYLSRVRRLEDRLRAEVTVPGPDGRPVPGLTKVLSLADGVVAASPVDPDEMPQGIRRNVLVKVALRLFELKMPALYGALHGEDPEEPGRWWLRVMLRSMEQQPSEQKQAIIAQVEAICRQEFPPSAESPGAEVTGFFVLLTNLIHSVLSDQWITFGVATAAIGLLMIVAVRSPVLGLMALVPNALPITIVTGLMGWAGMKINMGAAMIAAVSMGLSIDSSIHYLAAFRRARARGTPLDEALAMVHQSVGRAMVFSILALIVGFTALATSEFLPTICFGALVSLTMLGGLAGNLVALPLLIKLVTGGRPAPRS